LRQVILASGIIPLHEVNLVYQSGCTSFLEYNKNETDELKKWKFMYQCNNEEHTNNIVKNITFDILNKQNEIKEEIYRVK